jgi:predicted ATP-grasp superfamily ATP-dependent carboligase
VRRATTTPWRAAAAGPDGEHALALSDYEPAHSLRRDSSYPHGVESGTGPDHLRRRQLIVLGSDVTALAVVRGAYHLGVSSVVVDNRSGIATASRLAHADVHAALRTTELVPRIRELAERAPSSLLATSDVWLRAIVAHRAELSVNGMDILHPDNARLEICMDKSRFAAWCEQNWLPAPRSYAVPPDLSTETRGSVAFPALVRSAEHSQLVATAPKAIEVRCGQELVQCLDGYRRAGAVPFVGESLLGRRLQQFSVGAAVSAPTMMTVVTRNLRPPPAACGVGSLVEVTQQPDVERLAQRALLALDYHGIAEVEILRDEDSGEVFLIEVNARPWRQFAIAAAHGTDLLAFVLERRASARSSPTTYRHHRAVWLDFRYDLRVCFGTNGLVRTRRLGLWAYLRSIARANVFARWSLSDPLPAWRDFCSLLRRALSRAFGLQ